jgi:hypothetical protein
MSLKIHVTNVQLHPAFHSNQLDTETDFRYHKDLNHREPKIVLAIQGQEVVEQSQRHAIRHLKRQHGSNE